MRWSLAMLGTVAMAAEPTPVPQDVIASIRFAGVEAARFPFAEMQRHQIGDALHLALLRFGKPVPRGYLRNDAVVLLAWDGVRWTEIYRSIGVYGDAGDDSGLHCDGFAVVGISPPTWRLSWSWRGSGHITRTEVMSWVDGAERAVSVISGSKEYPDAGPRGYGFHAAEWELSALSAWMVDQPRPSVPSPPIRAPLPEFSELSGGPAHNSIDAEGFQRFDDGYWRIGNDLRFASAGWTRREAAPGGMANRKALFRWQDERWQPLLASTGGADGQPRRFQGVDVISQDPPRFVLGWQTLDGQAERQEVHALDAAGAQLVEVIDGERRGEVTVWRSRPELAGAAATAARAAAVAGEWAR